MESLKLSKLIGDEIIDMRCHYIAENEYGLQEFHSYIKLANNGVISIPMSDNDDFMKLTPENLSYMIKRFESGYVIDDNFKIRIINQKIVDFWFRYYNDELDYGCAYIQLTNGLYLTENNFGPLGLTDIDAFTFNEQDFSDAKKQWDIRSFLAMKSEMK